MPTNATSPRTERRKPGRIASGRVGLWFAATEGTRAALGSIRAHAFRSFLTTLGIVIGVASVIAMVSIIQGLNYFIGQQFQGLGSNSLTVQSYTSRENFLQGRRARLTEEDLDLIRFRVSGISSITPVMQSQTGGRVRYGSQTTNTQVIGTTYTYQDIGQYFAKHGRFLSESDDDTRRRVVVIGDQVREDLSLPENPVGEFIEIGGDWLKIIGLLEEKGEILGQSQDNLAVVPFRTMASLQGNQREPDMWIQLAIADLNELDNITQTIARLLRSAHDLDEDEEDDFRLQTAQQLRDTIDSILNVITAGAAGIVGISLLVGGIGIMNIMLVSVTERTREIGICKAIGAKRHHILLQFLLEAFALCVAGGLVGVAIGYGIGALVASIIPGMPAAHTPWWAIVLALGFSGMVGIVFGILPAAKAANLDPISSLRYE